jgi:hypothetical protein
MHTFCLSPPWTRRRRMIAQKINLIAYMFQLKAGNVVS